METKTVFLLFKQYGYVDRTRLTRLKVTLSKRSTYQYSTVHEQLESVFFVFSAVGPVEQFISEQERPTTGLYLWQKNLSLV